MSVDFLHPNVLAFFSTSSIVTILGFRNPKKKKRTSRESIDSNVITIKKRFRTTASRVTTVSRV